MALIEMSLGSRTVVREALFEALYFSPNSIRIDTEAYSKSLSKKLLIEPFLVILDDFLEVSKD